MQLAISALDLVNFPENSALFEIHVITKFAGSNKVEIVDVIIPAIRETAAQSLAKRAQESIK